MFNSQRRTGLRTLRNLAHRIATDVARFRPAIVAFYNDPAVTAALYLIEDACRSFVEEADRVLGTGV